MEIFNDWYQKTIFMAFFGELTFVHVRSLRWRELIKEVDLSGNKVIEDKTVLDTKLRKREQLDDYFWVVLTSEVNSHQSSVEVLCVVPEMIWIFHQDFGGRIVFT